MPRSAGVWVALSLVALSLTACSQPDQETHFGLKGDPGTISYLEDSARSTAEALGINNPPEVRTVRIVSDTEWARTHIECLTAAGYKVQYTTDGEGVQYPQILDEAQAQNFNLALYTCEVEYPRSPIYDAPLSDSQLQYLYQYRIGELRECLTQQGYPPTSAPPSLSVFRDEGGFWSWYQSIAVPENQLSGLRNACPESPPYEEVAVQ